jgi:hypothetical protein
MSAVVAFLMSAGGRLLFSYVADWFNKHQQHTQEMAMLKMQAELDDRRHERDMQSIRLQSDLKIEQVQVAGDIDLEKIRDAGFFRAIEAAENAPLTGIKFVDGWNRCIRPGWATVALLLWVLKVGAQIVQVFTNDGNLGQVMDAFDTALLASIAGFYFANREIAKGNK